MSLTSKITSAVFGLTFLVSPAIAWESLNEMNRYINHTNFIIEDNCSGTLISKTDKLIVTAYHCIDNKISRKTKEEVQDDGTVKKVTYEKRDRVDVSQKNYKDYEQVGSISYVTEIIGYDKTRDTALLQLVGDDLRSEVAAPVLHSDEELIRGEKVFAVGNPRMLDASVTAGVISNLNRSFDSMTNRSADDKVPMIQFDANIQPGSSGGGLFNSDGRYIGTVVAHYRGSDLSLAVPYFVLHELLRENCYAELFDPEADDLACRGEDEEETEVDDEITVPDCREEPC